MKTLLLVLLLTSGCATAKKTTGFLGAVFSGAGQGMQNAQRSQYHCTKWGDQITCR